MSGSERASVDLGPLTFSIDAASFSALPAATSEVYQEAASSPRAAPDGNDRVGRDTAPILTGRFAPEETASAGGTTPLVTPLPEATPNRDADSELSTGTTGEAAGHDLSADAPVWEVDRLSWPAVCNHLLQQEQEYFAHAGQKLRDASQHGLKVLAVTSTRPGAGCTTLAICLARAATAAGARVALVDADWQRPQLTAELGIELAQGWAELVSGRAPWVETSVICLEDGLVIFPAAAGGEAPSVTPPHAGSVLRNVADHFDLLVLDAGPLRVGQTQCLLRGDSAAGVDAAIVVRDCRQTSRGETLAATRDLKSGGVQAVGIAENFIPPEMASAAA